MEEEPEGATEEEDDEEEVTVEVSSILICVCIGPRRKEVTAATRGEALSGVRHPPPIADAPSRVPPSLYFLDAPDPIPTPTSILPLELILGIDLADCSSTGVL